MGPYWWFLEIKEMFVYRKNKNYLDKLMQDNEFKEKFKEEYQNVCIGEQIAKARYKAKLTQEELAKRINTTKSAFTQYSFFLYCPLPFLHIPAFVIANKI